MPETVKAQTGIKYTAKKLAQGAARTLRRRYLTEKKTVNVDKLALDVMLLKGLINVEKKKFIYTPSASALCGQSQGNNPGYFAEEITPVLPQGVGDQQRIGNSVKLFSAFYKLNFRNGTGGVGTQSAPVKLKWYLIEVKGEIKTPVALVQDLFLPNQWLLAYNPLTPIYDTNSYMNPLTKSKYKIHRSGTKMISGDTVANQSQQRSLNIKMKYNNYHVKYSADGSNVVESGQLILVVLSSRGNSDPAVVSTLTGVIDTAVSTGMLVDRSYLSYIIDN